MTTGAKTYQGRPCNRCHGTERYVNHSGCVACAKERSRIRYASHPEGQRIYNRRHYLRHRQTVLDRQRTYRETGKYKGRLWKRYQEQIERVMWRAAKSRAKASGLEFKILIEDITIPEFCPVLGIRLQSRKGGHHAASPALDRIDNTMGYVPGNVRVISWRANHLKNNGSLSELILIGEDAKRQLSILATKAVPPSPA